MIHHLPQAGGEICLLPGIHRANVAIQGRQNIKISGCDRRTVLIPRPQTINDPVFQVEDSVNVILEHMGLMLFGGTAIRLLRSQMDRLREIAIRNNRILACVNARFLSENLQGVMVPCAPEGCEHVYHQYTVRVPGGRRDALKAYLQEHQVGCEVYYPLPVHQQSFYIQQLGYRVSLPEAERAAIEVLSLPVHPALSQADLETIVSGVYEFMNLS